MNKQQIIELVRRNLQGSDAPISVRRKYDPRLVELYVEMAYNDLLNKLYDDGIKKGNDFSALDNFGKAYKRSVKWDADREEYYFDLEMDIVPLPDSQGIRLVSPYKNQAAMYDYRDNNSQSVFSKLLNDVVSNVGWFYVELPLVFLGNINTSIHNPAELNSQVMVKVIPPFNKLSDTDEIFLPGGNNMVLFQMVYNAVNTTNQNPESQFNNNSSKQI